MGGLEAAAATLAAQPGGDRLPHHQGQLTLEHLHHHHHHHHHHHLPQLSALKKYFKFTKNKNFSKFIMSECVSLIKPSLPSYNSNQDNI